MKVLHSMSGINGSLKNCQQYWISVGDSNIIFIYFIEVKQSILSFGFLNVSIVNDKDHCSKLILFEIFYTKLLDYYTLLILKLVYINDRLGY